MVHAILSIEIFKIKMGWPLKDVVLQKAAMVFMEIALRKGL